jgi:hypothetical protein
MAINKPTGRQRTLKKRSQLKSSLAGQRTITKRSTVSGRFVDQKIFSGPSFEILSLGDQTCGARWLADLVCEQPELFRRLDPFRHSILHLVHCFVDFGGLAESR